MRFVHGILVVLAAIQPHAVLAAEMDDHDCLSSCPDLPLRILAAGELGGDSPMVEVGESSDWIALVGLPEGYHLLPARVRIDAYYLDGQDSKDGPYTGRLVTTTPWQRPIVLFQGGHLKLGPVKSADGWRPGGALAFQEIRLGRRRYHFGVDAPCTNAGDASDWRACQWVLTNGDLRQVLYEIRVDVDAHGEPVARHEEAGVKFAGDLDGDGKLDLVLNAVDHENHINHTRLYLSSLAKEGALVGVAGVFFHVGS